MKQTIPPSVDRPGPGVTAAFTRKSAAFRPDIEGLRALAVLSVLIYHLRSEWLPGGFVGVDIFFVISGFLITSHLVKEHDKTGSISLGRFFARRMIRLIPAATVVLLTTALATVVFVPRILWKQIGYDIAGSATYVINWVLASRSVDYLAEDSVVSPVQHFWSLAVEEQFYLLWPLLIILAALIAGRFGFAKRRTLVVAGVTVFVLSLAAALASEAAGDVTAYFATTTRLWELASGAIAALVFVSARRRLPVWVLRSGFYIGLLAVLTSMVLIGDQTQWPGVWTILPIGGATLIVLCGGLTTTTQGERALSLPPLVWVGGISYSLYLWHWPVIVLAGYVMRDIGLLDLALIAVVSVALAWASNTLIENRIRFSAWVKSRVRYGLFIGLGSALLTVAVAIGLIVAAPGSALQAPDGARPDGASVLDPLVDQVSADALRAQPKWALPSPFEAPDDVPQLYADGCQQDQTSDEVVSCIYGDTSSSRIIALVGDSKAAQWLPALDRIAIQDGFQLVTMTKSTCAFSAAASIVDGKEYESCTRWNDNVMDALGDLRPDLVLTSTVQSYSWDGGTGSNSSAARVRAMEDGLETRLRDVQELGTKVVILADTPHPPGSVYECVAEQPDDVAGCGFNFSTAIAASALPSQLAAATALGATMSDPINGTVVGTNPDIALVDLNSYICPPQVADNCPPIIGNVLIYRQGSHVTSTYVESMTTQIALHLSDTGMLVPGQ
jgi:peptidoglycan/LPS O-acetylase OafA/YrhL